MTNYFKREIHFLKLKDGFLDAEMIHPTNPGLVSLNAQRKYLKKANFFI